MAQALTIAKHGNLELFLLPALANRHGLITGATGTGKTVSLSVRLIRSKGVGVYFVTQNPLDVPDKVLGRLGNRIQHALRASTPRIRRRSRPRCGPMRSSTPKKSSPSSASVKR